MVMHWNEFYEKMRLLKEYKCIAMTIELVKRHSY